MPPGWQDRKPQPSLSFLQCAAQPYRSAQPLDLRWLHLCEACKCGRALQKSIISAGGAAVEYLHPHCVGLLVPSLFCLPPVACDHPCSAAPMSTTPQVPKLVEPPCLMSPAHFIIKPQWHKQRQDKNSVPSPTARKGTGPIPCPAWGLLLQAGEDPGCLLVFSGC